MMHLATLSERISDTHSRILWSTGVKKYGLLDIHLTKASPDAALIGELIAMHHLLYEKQVLDRQPLDGGGLSFKVSKGAIKKLARGKSDKSFAAKLAYFLTHRMADAELIVTQSRERLPDPAECEPEILTVDIDSYVPPGDVIDCPALGRVVITKHAVERYAERLTSGETARPWASLARRLMHPNLPRRELPRKVLEHKKRKYGDTGDEYWGHESSDWTFVLTPLDNGTKRVPTVYHRKDFEKRVPKYKGAFHEDFRD